MARVGIDKSYFTFVKGLNTDAGPLTYPDNYSLDEENFELFIDGSRRRRLGVNWTTGDNYIGEGARTNYKTYLTSCHYWTSPGGDSSKKFLVIFYATAFYIYDISDGTFPTTNFDAYGPGGSGAVGSGHMYEEEWYSAEGDGRLWLVNKYHRPVVLTYVPSTGDVFGTTLTPNVRDFDGSGELVPIDSKPSALTDSHAYDLLNQGWTYTNYTAYHAATSPNVYPSNTQIMAFGKDDSSPSTFDSAWLDEQFFKNTPAPKGHFILDVFNKDRATAWANDIDASGSITLTAEEATSAFECVEFFAGRVWLSGCLDTSLLGRVYFSKIVEPGDILKWNSDLPLHQEADPTSEHISDLIATDGGEVKLQEAGKIVALKTMGKSILCFSEKGVWAISGGDTGFKATDYQVRKISSSGTISPNSIVEVDGQIFYWGNAGDVTGIVRLYFDPQTFNIVSQNISEGVIRSFLLDISEDNYPYVRGLYDRHLNTIVWLYFDGVLPEVTFGTWGNMYNKVLNLNLSLGAFFVYKIYHTTSDGSLTSSNYETTPFITGMIHPTEDYSAGDNYLEEVKRDLRFIVFYPDGSNWRMVLARTDNTSFLDWEEFDSTGYDAIAYLETGNDIIQDAMRKKQATYVHCYFNRTETNVLNSSADLENPSGCQMRAKWDWTDHTNSGKYGVQQQVYRFNREWFAAGPYPESFDSGYPVITTKNKVRGIGKSLRLRFDSEEGKDCWILGWAINYTKPKAA